MKHKLQTGTNPGLIVPVDLIAFCVGAADQHDPDYGTSTFAGATTLYTNQVGTMDAYLGVNVVRPLSEAPLQPLTQGIHLHWALPNAFTKGETNDTGNLAFPVVPDRWLVSRLLISGMNVIRTSWIVESDFLEMMVPEGQQAITLPVIRENEEDQNYRYAGRSWPFDESWKETGEPGRFAELTGQPLSAVASGDSAFAAFYPNCRSLFGFQDTLEDVEVAPGENATVMYEVTGWFSDPLADPLSGGKTKEELGELYNWTYTGETSPDYSLYSGIVQGIHWNPSEAYVTGHGSAIFDATVAIGNTPSESFAAYFKETLYPEDAFFETLLNAFQNGLLSEFTQPSVDQLSQLEQDLHGKTFTNYTAGTIYQVTQAEKDTAEEEEVTLPLSLSESLNQLNIYQQQCDFYASYCRTFQWELFSCWYKLMLDPESNDRSNLYNTLYRNLYIVWPQLQATFAELQKSLDNQLALLNNQLTSYDQKLYLQTTASSRYWQPNEPNIVFTADSLNNALRASVLKQNYPEGALYCRTTEQLISEVKIGSVTLFASAYASCDLPDTNHLPYPDSCNELILESILMNSSIGSNASGIPIAELEADLQAAMNGADQGTYAFDGRVPSPIEVNWWNDNPFFPVYAQWEVDFYPVEATEKNSQSVDYTPDLFTANYTIDQQNGGHVVYGGTLNPASIDFRNVQEYNAQTIVSNSAAQAFKAQLDEYFAVTGTDDPALQEVADALQTGVFFSCPLSGFNDLLAMREQSLQLNIQVPVTNLYWQITEDLRAVAGDINTVSPLPNGHFNPVRAGFFTFRLTLVDVFGQKRIVNNDTTITSQQLTTIYNSLAISNTVYMPAALAQPSRLLFRWLAAVGDEIQEMNSHPSTTPICGWLLTNHLNGSLFIYDQQGVSMGTLELNGDGTSVIWQSAPGDNATIDADIYEVFELQNPHLRDLAYALYNNGADFFKQFWLAIDNMNNFTDPQNYAQSSDLAVLMGRPLALAEVMLRLEADSSPLQNQSWATISEATDNGTTEVQFPVILGDMYQVNDGLIGYFVQDGEGAFDFSTFYCEGGGDSENGVVVPTQDTLTLTVSPKLDSTEPYDTLAGAKYVLMLLDPRAEVHASMGILPTKSIDIPSDQYADTLGILEMTFLASPLLRGASVLAGEGGATGFNLPLPDEDGFRWSWLQEMNLDGKDIWETTSDLEYNGSEAIAAYTPQTIVEGWLRLNPLMLSFVLTNSDGKTAATAGTSNTLTLTITNRKQTEISFSPGDITTEDESENTSLIFIHFGKLVSQDDVSSVIFNCSGWAFKALKDDRLGEYWGMAPFEETLLPSQESIIVTLSNVQVTEQTGQVQVDFDYINIQGLNDGVDETLITLIN